MGAEKGGRGCAHWIVIRKSEEKRSIARRRGRWEDSIENCVRGHGIDSFGSEQGHELL